MSHVSLFIQRSFYPSNAHAIQPFSFIAEAPPVCVCVRVQLNANVLSAMLTLDTGGGACTVKRLVGGQLDVSTGALTAAVVYGAPCFPLTARAEGDSNPSTRG